RSPSTPTADLQAIDLERSFAASSATPVPQDGSLPPSSAEDAPLQEASARPATPPRTRPGSSRSTGATSAAGGDVRVSQQVFVSLEKETSRTTCRPCRSTRWRRRLPCEEDAPRERPGEHRGVGVLLRRGLVRRRAPAAAHDVAAGPSGG
ncbi:unnamed protein product, partial [Prorocentrum cordatum]